MRTWDGLRARARAAIRADDAVAAAADDPAARTAAWDAWMVDAHTPQKPPVGDWSTWLFLGGRGAGKTRAGAEWLSLHAEPGVRLAIVGQSIDAVRSVMVEGESGLIRCAACDALRPRWESSRQRVLWPNGAFAEASAPRTRRLCAGRSSTTPGATSGRRGSGPSMRWRC